MKTYINIIALLITFNFAQAQEIQYVSAENGLIVRDNPSRGAKRIAKLEYGTQLEIMEYSQLKLDVVDNGEKISGEWVKIMTTNEAEDVSAGYVFNGFLTKKELKKRLKIDFDEFIVTIDNLKIYPIETEHQTKNDTIFMTVELGETPENKMIQVKHLQDFSKIEVFQKHENSITIMDEGPHCDLVNWKHYTSSWKPLRAITKHKKFKTNAYTEKEWNTFIDINLEDLKTAVKNACGDKWSNLIKNANSVETYPIGVSISKIYLRVVMTDLDGNKIEKVIAFEIPMGC